MIAPPPRAAGAAVPVRRLLAPLVATAVLTGLVLAVLDLGLADLGAGVRERLTTLAPAPLLAAFGVYALVYAGRAVRFAILLPGATGLLHLGTVAARHNFLNLVLPFRSGELALPWMLKVESRRPLAEGAAALLVCRVLDLFCVFAYASLGLAWSGAPWLRDTDAAPEARAARTRILVVLAVLAALLAALRPVARFAAARLRSDRGRVRGCAARAATHVSELGRARLAGAIVASLATWLLTYTTFWLLLRAMAGPDEVGLRLGAIDFARSLVGTTGLHLSTVLPVNTFGGLGSWELGWVAGYVLLAGLDREAAGISAVVSHVAIFAFITVLGSLGFLLRRKVAKEPAPDLPPPDATPPADG
jgi:hypothetical protein